jgi:phytoene dehydrogenase-like protein
LTFSAFSINLVLAFEGGAKMSAEERYDIVIIGAGHNGTTAAAYLSKCGLSVCVLEERPECGGAQENADPIAGVHTSPHAVGLYAAAAPGFEQLELWKYGFRMDPKAREIISSHLASGGFMAVPTTDGLANASPKDLAGLLKLCGFIGSPPFMEELLRATFWCPPHPPEVEVNAETIPFMQVYKERLPEVWTPELLEMTMFDFMDEYMETEPFKTWMAYMAWMSGAAGHFEGMAIPAFAALVGAVLSGPPFVGMTPMGGIHGYYHSIFRCAVAHGAVFRTCCPVDEIIIRDGRAVGVRLRDNASLGGKIIWANKAVLSATDIKQTFLKFIGPQYLDASFAQRIKDLNIKGGSIYVNHFLTREPLRFRPKFKGFETSGASYPMDSREIYYGHTADVMGRQGNPTVPPEREIWLWAGGSRYYSPFNALCTRPGRYAECSIEFYVPPPEYHVGGPDAINKVKDEMNAYVRQAISQVVENLNSDNIVYHWALTPYEQEFRNTGMLGGSWYGIRHCRDQWWNERPLPELARYRTPIDGLYLCHQSSAHPGGLCLMAVAYNLMHILIEDGIAEPGDWWYPSPWYIPEKGKISAVPHEGKVRA